MKKQKYQGNENKEVHSENHDDSDHDMHPRMSGSKLLRCMNIIDQNYTTVDVPDRVNNGGKSSGGTPMTTHYHEKSRTLSPAERNQHKDNGGVSLRRSRSRSLGAEQEIEEWTSFVDKVASSSSIDELLHQEKEERRESSSLVKGGDRKQHGNPLYICIMYGLINAIIVLPVLMSFAAIIYRDDAFQPYMPVLTKLTVVSGMVHQLCFSILSSLPFAIGQVQDAGLIFLSQMAKQIASYCKDRGHDDEVMLATVTVGLGLSTALLGIGLVLIGKLRLAQYVQLLPTGVVGGYLAFIGWFCGESGLALMCGVSELSFKIFIEQWIYWLPGLCGGISIYLSVRILRNMVVLPSCIFIIFISFYVGLFATNTSIKEATSNGWISQADKAPPFWLTWQYIQFDKVVWSALPPQILTLLSMTLVVALSSSLDVAAIELELKSPLNYNHELTMVGISNIISGSTGGYTGSYIFSQSIFSLRAGIRSRMAGFVVAVAEFIVVVLPFPILSFIPNFFFGSLLTMISLDLMYEWLWDVRLKLTTAEYGICLCTFILIQFFGVEYGILLGVVVYLIIRKLGFNLGNNQVEDPLIENGQQQQQKDSTTDDSSNAHKMKALYMGKSSTEDSSLSLQTDTNEHYGAIDESLVI